MQSSRIDGIPSGPPDRAVSYPSNTWEYYNEERESNYTYFCPLEKTMVEKPIDVVGLVMECGINNVKPHVYLTAYPVPFEERELILYERE